MKNLHPAHYTQSLIGPIQVLDSSIRAPNLRWLKIAADDIFPFPPANQTGK